MDFIKKVQDALPEIDEYASRLLGWMMCVPYLKESYIKNKIDEDIFYQSMRDFYFKYNECNDVYKTNGLFVDWFFLFFECVYSASEETFSCLPIISSIATMPPIPS